MSCSTSLRKPCPKAASWWYSATQAWSSPTPTRLSLKKPNSNVPRTRYHSTLPSRTSTPKESWELFGPPSRALRWCCAVHKSTPQTLKLREVTGKDNYTGLAFVGVRAHESATRAGYDYFNDSKKIKGQFSHNSVLEWTSAEVWLYIYANNVLINEAYKKR